ncbi:MAG: hypothetical protein H0T05_03505 [Acidobacteria bacterium]|nr:hypothetical protein [Acidobacteriota bacterium]MBA3885402.1 hypothetical protein [Acidobacteriota bacterium]
MQNRLVWRSLAAAALLAISLIAEPVVRAQTPAVKIDFRAVTGDGKPPVTNLEPSDVVLRIGGKP